MHIPISLANEANCSTLRCGALLATPSCGSWAAAWHCVASCRSSWRSRSGHTRKAWWTERLIGVLALGCSHLINTCMPFRRYNTNESHASRYARCVRSFFAAEDHVFPASLLLLCSESRPICMRILPDLPIHSSTPSFRFACLSLRRQISLVLVHMHGHLREPL